MEKVNTTIILDTRRMMKDHKYPVRLRITNKGKRKTYLLGINLSKEGWDKVHGENPRKQYRDYQIKFAAVEDKARKIIELMGPFTFEKFELLFNKSSSVSKDLFSLFEDYIVSSISKCTFQG